jgi:hypothetical protein
VAPAFCPRDDTFSRRSDVQRWFVRILRSHAQGDGALLWADEIQPPLLKRYPGLSEDRLKQAHAYAYGGAVIQDLGYYPFGSKEFSNLVHYVRSGDFVLELMKARMSTSTPLRWAHCRTMRQILE